ncbi:APC family permease [Streptomyces adustus]|uniref:APC family permease n=1 Tax=Streptomyces adustus TaxID=1609272 RepID=UPI00372144AD
MSQLRSSTSRTHLSTWHIVFVIVAAAAPLSAMVGTVPLAFAVGNGPGVPAAFAFAGLTLLCFAVGYAVSARRTGGSGGFYTSIADGLGRPAAVAGGFVAVLSYNAATIGLVGAQGYFTRLVLAAHGYHVSWQVCALAGVALVAVLGHREITLSARLLALLMIGETGVLLALDIAVLVRHGAAALPAASFGHQATGPGLGVAMMFAFVSFIGFESAALYGGEARNPRRNVVRATYAAVVLISVFYTLTSWLAVGAVGARNVRATAGAQLGDLFFVLAGDYLGTAGRTVLEVLLCTSLFAATLALHSAANRYAHVLATDGLLPAALSARHPRYGSPHRASTLQSVLNLVAVAVFAAAGLDPYADMTTSMLGLGTLGIIVLQAAAALSVIGLLRRGGGAGVWQGLVAPLLAFAGLTATVWLVLGNYSLLTGTDSAVVGALPWTLPVLALLGAGYAWWLRTNRPDTYRGLAGRGGGERAVPVAVAPGAAQASVTRPD